MANPRQTDLEPVVRTLAVRLPSGHRIVEHRHAWGQVVFAIRGVLRVEAARQHWVVPPLRCLWVPAGTSHSIETVGEAWMRTVYLRPRPGRREAAQTRVLEVGSLLREVLLEVVRRGRLGGRGEDRHLAGLLRAQLASAPDFGPALTLPDDPRARRVAERVRRDPGDAATLESLASGTGASPRTVERLFAEQTGMPFGRWRQQARLQHAVRLLAEGHSVTRTALACGYESTSAFVSMFRSQLGRTPGKYAAKLGRCAP